MWTMSLRGPARSPVPWPMLVAGGNCWPAAPSPCGTGCSTHFNSLPLRASLVGEDLVAVVLAAGEGSRVANQEPKQFIT